MAKQCAAGHLMASQWETCQICGAGVMGESRCENSHVVAAGETTCPHCGSTIAARPSRPVRLERAPSGLTDTRRLVLRRAAGALITVGGICLAVSLPLTWVAGASISVSLGLFNFAIVLTMAMVSMAMGLRVLVKRMTLLVMVMLWLLSAIEIWFIYRLDNELIDFADALGLLGASADPSPGFYVALVGVIAVVIGTIVVQIAMIERG